MVSNDLIAVQKTWCRSYGPEIELDWLRNGRLTESPPGWFLDLFCRTRDIAATNATSPALGMSTLEENWCLYKLVQEVNPSRTLEIGICRGATSRVIARSIKDLGIACIHTALDIDSEAIQTIRDHFARDGVSSLLTAIQADSHTWLAQQTDMWQFVFIDGDHSFGGVVCDFVQAYNRLDVGGLIALHDIGSILWGFHGLTGPSRLFFGALDRELGPNVALGWLDSSERSVDFRLLGSRGLRSRMLDILRALGEGWGGIGIVRKLNSGPPLQREQFLKYAPEAGQSGQHSRSGPMDSPNTSSIIGGVLARCRRLMGRRP